MKNTFLTLILICCFLGCKEDAKKEVTTEDSVPEADINKENEGIKQLQGEFIYYADAAVLQTPTEVYGVVIDSMMHVLQNKVEVYKNEATDMVPVAIRGKITAKPEGEEGWPYRVQVLEVIEVYKPQPENNNVIKIEKQTK